MLKFFSKKKIIFIYTFSVAVFSLLFYLATFLKLLLIPSVSNGIIGLIPTINFFVSLGFIAISLGIISFLYERKAYSGFFGLLAACLGIIKIFIGFGIFSNSGSLEFTTADTSFFIATSFVLIGTAFIFRVLDKKNDTHFPEIASLAVFLFSLFSFGTYFFGGITLPLFSTTSFSSSTLLVLLSLGLLFSFYYKSLHQLRSRFLVMTVLAVTVFTMVVITLVAERIIYSTLENSFDREVNQMTNDLVDRMNIYISALEGGKGFFNGSDSVTREAWKNYVDTLSINNNYPGIQGLGYAEFISPAEKNNHIQNIRSQGFPDYTISPTGNREIYTSIIYLEPFDERNRQAFGYDMFSNELRREAMEQARDTGFPRMSDGVVLVQEIDEDVQVGFLIYVPVYKKNASLETINDRRKNILGYVYSPFRTNNLIEGIFDQKQFEKIKLSLFTSSDLDAESRLYGSLPQEFQQINNSHFVEMREIIVAGKKITVYFESTDSFSKNILYRTIPLIILITGIGISLLATLIFYTIVSSKQRAEIYAAQLTKDLKKQVSKLETTLAEKRQLNDMFEGAFKNSPIGFCIVSLDEIWVRVNDRLARLLGYPVDDLIGTSISELTLPEDFKKEQKKNSKLLENKRGIYQLKKRFIHKNGHQVWVESSVGLVRNHLNEPQFFIAQVRDITAEENIDQTKTDFVSLASHQMRTPLSSINWFLEMLLDHEEDLNTKQKEYLERISKSSERMVELIDDLLNISRVELGTLVLSLENLDIVSVVKQAVEENELHAKEKNMKMKITIIGDNTELLSDRGNINIIIDNILSNAIKYGFEKTTVLIDIKFFVSHVVLSVSNTGYGIPSSEHNQIFTKMYRANNIKSQESEGFGLGLYLIKKLILQLKGSIDFTSEENKQTVFNITLPYEL